MTISSIPVFLPVTQWYFYLCIGTGTKSTILMSLTSFTKRTVVSLWTDLGEAQCTPFLLNAVLKRTQRGITTVPWFRTLSGSFCVAVLKTRGHLGETSLRNFRRTSCFHGTVGTSELWSLRSTKHKSNCVTEVWSIFCSKNTKVASTVDCRPVRYQYQYGSHR